MNPEIIERGQKLLATVERLLDPPESIQERVRGLRREAGPSLERLVDRVIDLYVGKSAVSGGATAIPAMLPGVGTLLGTLGGSLADTAFLLKYQVEMCLALSAAYGYDITKAHERKLAILVAATTMHEAQTGRNLLKDVGAMSKKGAFSMNPQDLAKALAPVFGTIAIGYAAKTVLRAIPLVGVGVGATMNRTLTAKVGKKANEQLQARKKIGL
jgi:uncharacterized protein (DUF697 family)